MIKALELSDFSVFYDLGCGDARVLVEAKKLYPQIVCRGIEKDGLAFFLARLKVRNKNIEIKRGDIFEEDLSGASHIFTYLFPELMDELLPKLEKELKPGARLVSCAFAFSKKQPASVIQAQKKIFIYNF